MGLNNDMAALVGFGFEAFFYGCYTILFALAIYLKLNGPNRTNSVKGPLLILSVILYLTCSTHFILVFIYSYEVLNSTGVNGFAIETNPIAPGLLVVIANFIGELILIYRCWVLWSKNYWIIFVPCLTLISWIVSVGVDFPLYQKESSLAVAETLGHASFYVSLSENVILTTLIVVRIWRLSPRHRRDILGQNFPVGTGRTALAIVIESGMLYLSVQFTYCILYVIGNPAHLILVGIALQVFGIAPTLIFIRMSGLLNTPSGLMRSSTAVTQVGFSDRTTAPTNPALCISVDMPMSAIKSKPGGEDLGSNFSSKFSSVDNPTAV